MNALHGIDFVASFCVALVTTLAPQVRQQTRPTPQQIGDVMVQHLTDIAAPMLFLQGSRDAFGTPAELRPILAKLEPPAELHVVEDGDHSFKVPKRAGISQDAVYEVILDRIERWLRETVAGR